MTNIKYLRCMKCGADATPIWTGIPARKTEVGTSTTMKCPDCCQPDDNGYAAMCRFCCPSGHRTLYYDAWMAVGILDRACEYLQNDAGARDVQWSQELDNACHLLARKADHLRALACKAEVK